MLRDYQQDFASAVLASQPSVVDTTWFRETAYPVSLGMAVYRNNYIAGLSEVLGDIYPVVKQIVGNGFFAYMSHEFIRANPPTSPVLSLYGETYADFIDGFAPADTVPYLSDIAMLEQLRHQALQSPNARPLEPARLAEITEDRISGIVFRLHPSCRLLHSAYDVLAVQCAHETGTEIDAGLDPAARGNFLLVARPRTTVEVLELDGNTFEFLSALARGEPLGIASQIPDPDWNVTAVLTELLVFGAFTDFDHTEKSS